MAKQNYPSQLGQRDGLGAGRKLARLRLLPAEQIEFITSDGLPVFQPNAKFLEIEVAGTTSSFSENAGVSEPGAAYAWAVNFSLSKARPEVRDFIRRNILVRWVAFLQTVAGECQMVGFPDFPLQLQAGSSVGGGSNSSIFQLSGSGPEPALFLQGIDDDSLSGQGTFDAHFFSDVFNI